MYLYWDVKMFDDVLNFGFEDLWSDFLLFNASLVCEEHHSVSIIIKLFKFYWYFIIPKLPII